jgi:hypothetical protein
LALTNFIHTVDHRPLQSRDHHPSLLSNSEDADIQSSIVIIDPAHQDGSISGQGIFVDKQVRNAISRAKDAVIIVGNPCLPYPGIEDDKGYWKDMESALNAAQVFAWVRGGRLRLDKYQRCGFLVHPSEIPEALLLEEEGEAYAKLGKPDDDDPSTEIASDVQDGVGPAKDGSKENGKLAYLALFGVDEGGKK